MKILNFETNFNIFLGFYFFEWQTYFELKNASK
jgi:hypothetical protein